MLVSRISRRVLAEHHIALTEDFWNEKNSKTKTKSPAHVGIVHTELKPKDSIEKCVDLLKASSHSVIYANPDRPAKNKIECPPVVVDGHIDTKFAYIRDQFE